VVAAFVWWRTTWRNCDGVRGWISCRSSSRPTRRRARRSRAAACRRTAADCSIHYISPPPWCICSARWWWPWWWWRPRPVWIALVTSPQMRLVRLGLTAEVGDPAGWVVSS
jgi:hypothetical protein